MYWEEETSEESFSIPEEVIDLQFKVICSSLPVDHAWPLVQAIDKVLPWFSETQAGLHIIHCAESGNGWERPEQGDALLQLSKRTPLTLRLPAERAEDALALIGQTLDIAGHSMQILSAKKKKLAMTRFLYARYIAADPDLSEELFISWAVDELKQMGLRFKKILCGKNHQLQSPDGPIHTRSLMVAELSYEDAITLQEQGLGMHRSLGCGVFLPQKSF
ncbi:MAG: type I-MYXAN CRISPR-associated protein Cas6/Cmx6 [Sedimenticola sp.]|uniref:Type I-MYXAN CRISPR-associated protein Cas6/Cmx6 n=1 Tax=Sedimenticola thiotaurini TaxID=1543721 RepID=A0A558CY97_9GAMM|nr:type I-MYXAN CRISPR-associated protein Cas6/Cmx6 [Sedimenticola sp.]TVT53749.1 MAG: type I-MYXAN CRISPR-associated protein Cas6/Cmx6 [Sedimenticola thiotaurini]MCW8920189.1 type I-MYXAN CRISPR-associated protein Cas6/Cmx6 [Sedimenticola sp.]MCW8946194.1 type I-MYXAN CRISPR-associated protein Cas6/Cmx6 [Sedimenticola sp.]MCW8948486.1 type I-MYXAN CRISPR-associated protein Cas6/Cmx6 [Sedimenticola sp.]